MAASICLFRLWCGARRLLIVAALRLKVEAEEKAKAMPRPDLSQGVRLYAPEGRLPGTGVGALVWLPPMDLKRLTAANAPLPRALNTFVTRINADWPPTAYKGIAIDASHFLRKHVEPMRVGGGMMPPQQQAPLQQQQQPLSHPGGGDPRIMQQQCGASSDPRKRGAESAGLTAGQGASQAARLMQGNVAVSESGNDLYRQRRAARNAMG